jgi:hypothetical protein
MRRIALGLVVADDCLLPPTSTATTERRHVMKRALAVVSALAVGAFTTFAGSAAAGRDPTPNGYVGACNMSVSWPGFGVQNANGVGVQAGGGMENAMTVNQSQNTNGNDGMVHATNVSDEDGVGDCN